MQLLSRHVGYGKAAKTSVVYLLNYLYKLNFLIFYAFLLPTQDRFANSQAREQNVYLSYYMRPLCISIVAMHYGGSQEDT